MFLTGMAIVAVVLFVLLKTSFTDEQKLSLSIRKAQEKLNHEYSAWNESTTSLQRKEHPFPKKNKYINESVVISGMVKDVHSNGVIELEAIYESGCSLKVMLDISKDKALGLRTKQRVLAKGVIYIIHYDQGSSGKIYSTTIWLQNVDLQ